MDNLQQMAEQAAKNYDAAKKKAMESATPEQRKQLGQLFNELESSNGKDPFKLAGDLVNKAKSIMKTACICAFLTFATANAQDSMKIGKNYYKVEKMTKKQKRHVIVWGTVSGLSLVLATWVLVQTIKSK